MTTQGETNAPYSDLNTQPETTYSGGFVAVGSQYPQLSQATQPQYVQPQYVQPPYSQQLPQQQFPQQQYPQQQYPQQQLGQQFIQPTYEQPSYVIPQQQVIQVVEQKPVVDRYSAIMSQLHGRHCCGCFSYPTGVKIISSLQILWWFIWSIVLVGAHMWWAWLFAVSSMVMCYYGFKGASHLEERRLRMYFVYLVCMAVLNLVLIFVFVSNGYTGGIVGWIFSLFLMFYWCYIVRDFIRIIHEVDYGRGSILEQYHQASHDHHHHDHHHGHHHHDDHHHDDHH